MTTEQRSRLDIIQAARTNDAFRREVMTGSFEQVVVMTIPPGGEIGDEVHTDTDQVLFVVDGNGEATLESATSPVNANDLVFVRAGTRHNVVNSGVQPLRLISIYAPPHHPPGTVHQTKEDADEADQGAAVRQPGR